MHCLLEGISATHVLANTEIHPKLDLPAHYRIKQILRLLFSYCGFSVSGKKTTTYWPKFCFLEFPESKNSELHAFTSIFLATEKRKLTKVVT